VTRVAFTVVSLVDPVFAGATAQATKITLASAHFAGPRDRDLGPGLAPFPHRLTYVLVVALRPLFVPDET